MERDDHDTRSYTKSRRVWSFSQNTLSMVSHNKSLQKVHHSPMSENMWINIYHKFFVCLVPNFNLLTFQKLVVSCITGKVIVRTTRNLHFSQCCSWLHTYAEMFCSFCVDKTKQNSKKFPKPLTLIPQNTDQTRTAGASDLVLGNDDLTRQAVVRVWNRVV